MAILDAWSRKVVGYAISQLMDARIAVVALKAAIRNRMPIEGSTHPPSDRGSEYASEVYRELLVIRVVIVRMRGHQPTLDYVRRRTTKGKSKSEIIRCLKRYVAREIFGYLCAKQTSP